MNIPFHTRHAPGVEAARSVPTSNMIAPQPSVAEKLASGELYKMSLEDVRDRHWFPVFIRYDALTGIEYAAWRRGPGQPWQEVAIDVALCGACDNPAPTGICLECEA